MIKICIRGYLLLCFFLLLPVYSVSQTVISGRIKDKDGKAVAFVNVLLVKSCRDNTIINYTMSSDNGSYSLKAGNVGDSLHFIVKGFNIKTIYKTVPNRSEIVNFTVTEEKIELKEVVVKGGKVWQHSDTINFRVDAFKSAGDITIGEVIKKMPGLAVTSSGTIMYKGSPINKFYIEGLDLLKGRYGIAINNISPDKIATVQVLENHQPVQALKKVIISNDAAINLKFREDAKGIVSVIALLGVGYGGDVKAEGSIVSSYFSRTLQNMSMIKSNNSGRDLAAEIQNHYGAGENTSFTWMVKPSPPTISKYMYYDNRSNALTSNYISKDKNDGELSMGVYYFNDRDKRSSYARSSYLLPDGSRTVINENLSSSELTNNMSVESEYKINKEKIFLNDKLNFRAGWLSGNGKIFNTDSTYQHINTNNINISNSFNWIAKKGDYKGWNIVSSEGYSTNPQSLCISPSSFPKLFSGAPSLGLRQHVKLTNFYCNNSVENLAALMIKKVRIGYIIFANILGNRLNSSLLNENASGGYSLNKIDSLHNKTDYLNFSGGLSADISYSSNEFFFGLYVPVEYNFRRLDNYKGTTDYTSGRILATPSLSVSIRKIKWEYVLYYIMSNSHLGINQLYGGYILSNYRTLSAYEPNMSEQHYHTSNISVRYKDPADMLFFDAKALYSYYNITRLYGLSFDGIFSNITSEKVSTYGKSYGISANINKGFDWKKLGLKLNTSWSKSKMPQLRQGVIVRYMSDSYSATGSVNMEPFSFLELSASCFLNRAHSKLTDGTLVPSVTSVISDAEATVTLPLNILLNMSVYNYYNNIPSTGKSFTLSNLGLQYKYKTTIFFLDWNNIFNVKKYKYSSLDGINEYYSEYYIRPATILLRVQFKLK